MIKVKIINNKWNDSLPSSHVCHFYEIGDICYIERLYKEGWKGADLVRCTDKLIQAVEFEDFEPLTEQDRLQLALKLL